jgi:hypothetical protein
LESGKEIFHHLRTDTTHLIDGTRPEHRREINRGRIRHAPIGYRELEPHHRGEFDHETARRLERNRPTRF